MRVRICTLVILLFLICTIFLSSCGEIMRGETEYYYVLDSQSAAYKDGMFIVSLGVLNFVSFETMSAVPVCYKPNCNHSDANVCPAVLSAPYNTIFVYDDHLYSIESDYKFDKDGKPTIDTKLYVSNVSGTGKKTISSFDGFIVVTGVYVNDGIAHFAAEKIVFDETGNTTHYDAEYFCCCDLINGEFKEIKCITEGYNTDLSIIGCFNRELVLEYRLGTEDRELSSSKEYMIYDLESNEFQEVDKPVLRAQKDYLILEKSKDCIEIRSVYREESYFVTNSRFTDPIWGGLAIFDGKLIVYADGYAYDLETGDVYSTYPCTVIAYYDDRFIVRTIDNEYKSLSKEEFFSATC